MAVKKNWIKLWPEGLLSWEWINYPGMLDLWVRLLMLAAKNDGVVVTTEKELSLFCHVSRQQLRTMLANLISTKEITKESTKVSTKRATKITICKWGEYQQSQPSRQPSRQPNEQPSHQPQINQNETAIPISSPSESKHNIENIEKETPSIEGVKKDGDKSPLSKRQKKFYDELVPFLDTHGGPYPKEMIRAFYNYWSEPNRSKTKMRCELQQTWELPRRLETWASKEPMKKNNQQSQSVNEEWDEQKT